MTVVTVSYLLVAPTPEGFGLAITVGTGAGLAVAALFLGLFMRYAAGLSRRVAPATEISVD